MKSEVGNIIDFANDILKNNKRNRYEPKVHNNLIKYKKKGLYKILEYISEHVTLVQLMDSLARHDNLAVSEDASVDEAVPIDIRKERNTKAHKEKMGRYIKNIDTYETTTKVNTIKWRPIYEGIDEAYIEESKISPDDFIRYCKNNSNEAQFISAEVKNNIN